MSLTVVATPEDDGPTPAATASGKPVGPIEVDVAWPDPDLLALGQQPTVALYVDPTTARQICAAWQLWNQTFPGRPGRDRWVDDIVRLAHAAIEVETFTGDLPPADLMKSPFPLDVVRSIVQEQNAQHAALHPEAGEQR